MNRIFRELLTICNICKKNTDTRGGICGECTGEITKKSRKKEQSKQSVIVIIVLFVILIAIISFFSSDAYNITTEKIQETSYDIQETTSGIVKKLEEDQIQREKEQKITDEKYLQDIALKIHELINEERTTRGLSPLVWNPTLAQASVNHSTDMANRGYFEHNSPEGYDFTWRYSQVGFTCAISQGSWIYGGGENISYLEGYYGVDDISITVVKGWMNSPGHRGNILTSYFQSEGLGVAKSGSEIYVTQNFC